MSPWRKAAAVAVAALVMTGDLAACGVPHPGISSGSVTACYRAIPPATAALHEPGAHLVGVHRVPVSRVETHLPPSLRSGLGKPGTTVCVLVFRGHFAPGQVERARAAQQGNYAVILIDSRHLNLIAAFVLQRVPRTLGRHLL